MLNIAAEDNRADSLFPLHQKQTLKCSVGPLIHIDGRKLEGTAHATRQWRNIVQKATAKLQSTASSLKSDLRERERESYSEVRLQRRKLNKYLNSICSLNYKQTTDQIENARWN